MKPTLLVIAVVQCLVAGAATAAKLPFEKEGEPFYSRNLEIVWAATNKLPNTVQIFKVVPANFSPRAVSNLTQLGGAAAPMRGAMDFYKPQDVRLPLEKVPDQARAYELGAGLLARLEISISELRTDDGRLKAWFYPGSRGHFDKATRTFVTEPCEMGVEFRRVVDGINCLGQYAQIQFESQEAVTRLEVRWHGLQASGTHPVASSEQIVEWIKEGRARAQAVETTGSRWLKVADIKKVTIRDVVLCYDASPDLEHPKKSLDYLYPYAILTAEVEISPDDHETLGLFGPITKDALSRPVRETGEFNIYPSTLREKQAQREGGGE